MPIPLKLSDIDQEHLQEIYEAEAVPRDELPYSDALARLCQCFQDRTFKNASEEQVFGAIVKYVRSSRCKATEEVGEDVAAARQEHAKAWKDLRHGAKLQPYTPQFESARAEFSRRIGHELSPREFWRVLRTAVSRKPAPARA
ncbi:MAG TPA: hypothetical protein VFB66_28860 [Tepidisphaeraceae bacterium]|nr:hypothetical protein [Tepidisphaeraceae bacterium]